MTDTPGWFTASFGQSALDWARDLSDLDPGSIEPGTVHPTLQSRADQLWMAVVAHTAQPVSTAVDDPQPEPASTAVDDEPSGPESRRVYAMVPGRNEDGQAVMQPLYVTREAADMTAPKIDCPECGGNGETVVYEDLDGGGTGNGIERMCDACLGTGLVAAPPTPPRDTGTVPEDHPLMRAVSDEDRTAREALPPMPDHAVAAQVAAVKAQTERLAERP